jgi:hypothetical protein
MPLTSIRPVFIGFYKFTGEITPIDHQIISHFSNLSNSRRKEYHDVFSNPKKMFEMGLVSGNLFRRLVKEFPKFFNLSKEYILNFALKSRMWDLLSLDIDLNDEGWTILINSNDMGNKTLQVFLKNFLKSKITLGDMTVEYAKNILRRFIRSWKSPNQKSIAHKLMVISITESFGEIGEELVKELKREFTDYENSTKFCPSPKSSTSSVDEKDIDRLSLSSIVLPSIVLPSIVLPSILQNKDGYRTEDESWNYYDCGSDDDTLSPREDDDIEREMFVYEESAREICDSDHSSSDEE